MDRSISRHFAGPGSLKSLHVFCVAARLASFKEAANELYITASAVSHQIRGLEERLGFELFERRTRAVTLTKRGEALADSVGPLMDRMFEEMNAAVGAKPRESLHVLLPPFFATEIFIPSLSEFTERHPDIDIYLDTADARPDKSSASVDLAVLLSDTPPADRCSEELLELELVPACCPSYLRDYGVNEAIDYTTATLILHRQWKNSWKRWLKEAGQALERPPNVFELDSMSAVVQSAEQGIGVALVPLALTMSRFKSGSLLRLDGDTLTTQDKYYLCWDDSATKGGSVEALVVWIKEILSKEMLK